jgi:secondary thiamine-phosphate synthase enzyme
MEILRLETHQREQILDITKEVTQYVSRQKAASGLVAVYCPHTTAAVSINENADPDVKRDLLFHLGKAIPRSAEFHHSEDNADAHIKAVLTGLSLVVLVEGGNPLLGTWQGIYFCEFDGPRNREVWLKFIAG